MQKKLPESFLQVVDNNDGLKRYLSSLSDGRDFTPRTWLYEDQEPKQILDTWLQHLSVLQNGDAFQRNVFEFDVSQLAKWGPQGGISPIEDLLKDVVLPTFAEASPTPKAFRSHDWEEAKYAALLYLHSLGVYALQPSTYSNVVVDMKARDTLESNSGWPDFSRRNKPEVLQAAIAAAKDDEWLSFPAIALFRNYNLKTRLVWMFPEATNIVEGSYCQPVQNAIVKSTSLRAKFSFTEDGDLIFSPWVGFDAVRRLITNVYANHDLFLAASDFSNTDAHFGLETTHEVYDVLRKLFQKRSDLGLWLSLSHMHQIPLVIGPDKMLVGEHGLASGSNWTNFVESVFDLIFSKYVEVQTDYHTEALCAIGDDICWVSDTYNDALDQELERLGEEVGQHLNAEKVTNKENKVKFLQRLFQRGYRRPDGQLRGVYSTVRALKSSVYPERFHKTQDWSSDMFCARQFMILENCVDHPLFEEFVKYVVHGQRDLIPFARKSAKELDKITRQTKLLPGFNPTYNQEKRESSLATFKSIEYARVC